MSTEQDGGDSGLAPRAGASPRRRPERAGALATVPQRRRRAGRVLGAVDGAVRRHPAALAAAMFCGGLATGAWLGLSRGRGGRGASGRGLQDGPPLRAVGPLPDPESAAAATGRRVPGRRDPIGSPSVVQT